MKETPNLLIVDDERHTREGLRKALQKHFEVYLAADFASAMEILNSEKIDILLTDLKLGGNEDGMELLEQCKAKDDVPLCFMMTAYGTVDTAVEAMRRGAVDYFTKPVHLDKLEMTLRRAWSGASAEKENVLLRKELNQKFGLDQLIGKSHKMMEIFEMIRQVADSKATILIEGESGTGKELVAHAIHNLSTRKNKPFIPVHCAALSEQLLASELFGHERGAFTGAHEKRIGRFEQANGGTLFLDEIGEIDMPTQVKLLRVLSARTIERVGSNQSIPVDVRIVTATNRNLSQMVRDGTFREDLYFRIHVVRIEIPPLRERKDDIPLLAQSFLYEYAKENAKTQLSLSDAAMEMLIRYPWPGNVRELRSAVEHGVVLCKSDQILPKDLPPSLKGLADLPPTANFETLNLVQVEKSLIIKALEKTSGNRTEAAKLLGISRRTLHRKLHEYKLENV